MRPGALDGGDEAAVEVPGQQGLEVLDRGGLGQSGEDVPQVAVGLDPGSLGGFDDAVARGARMRTGGSIGEEPRFSPDADRADGIL